MNEIKEKRLKFRQKMTSTMSDSKWFKLLNLVNEKIACADCNQKPHEPYFYIKLLLQDESKIQFLPHSTGYTNKYFKDGELTLGPVDFEDIEYIKIPKIVQIMKKEYTQNLNQVIDYVNLKIKVSFTFNENEIIIYGYR